MTTDVRMPRPALDEIDRHALDAYPEECCGIVVERSGAVEVVRVTNVQNERHARDPALYPRTAATAYSMGPEHVPVLRDAEAGRLRLRAFYHSHPEHDAYFSVEDRAVALGGWGEPPYPEVAYVVVSVYGRRVKDLRAYVWDAAARDFREAPVVAE